MKTSWCFAGDTGVISGMMHKIQHRLSQSWKWPLPSDDLKPAVRWEQDVELLPQQVGSRGLLLAILPTRCNLSAAALQPCVWPRGLQWAFAHISGTGSSHIHQTHNTFLQLFLTSLFRNAFNSAVLLPSTVRSRILLSLWELHFPLHLLLLTITPGPKTFFLSFTFHLNAAFWNSLLCKLFFTIPAH